MFHWNAGIYMDDRVKKKPVKYRRMVEKRKLARACYCITLPVNETNCMEIYSSRELWFRYYQNRGLEIIGLASDEEGAQEILEKIASDVYREYGQVNAGCVKKYFHRQAQ